MRAVEAVGRHGSVTSAAKELHVTPGAVSRNLTLVEDRLDCKLFDRQRNGLSLTEKGRRYVDRLADAFALIDQANAQLLRTGERSRLIIRALGAFTTEWLLPRISAFESEHPDIEVLIRAKLRGVDFDKDEADVGIIASRNAPNRVESHRLYTPYLLPIAGPDLLTNALRIENVKDLNEFKLLHAMNIRPTWEQWASAVAPGVTLDTSRGYWLERSSQIYQAVRQGAGIGLGQFLLVGDDLIKGSLVSPIAKMTPSPGSIYLVWPKRQTVRPEVVLFKEWLLDSIADAQTALHKALPDVQLFGAS